MIQPASTMHIEWDVEIPMSDGNTLRADVFRPAGAGRFPLLMSHGPYAKGLAFQEGYTARWNKLVADFPEVMRDSSCRYANWETVDPERWVPFGYVCIRVDSRGAGRSPGTIDPFSPRETQDYYECIEWAAQQPWSTGKVGLAGISYYALNQWHVAALRPPHLAAICPWEGAADLYRDVLRHGGILSTFLTKWYPVQVKSVQHGVGSRGPVNPNTGEPVAGPSTLSPEELERHRVDFPGAHIAHPLLDDYFRERSPALEHIEVPLLSAGNWGGQGVHLRGNIEGFLAASSRQKWLEMHGLEHWTHFYTDYGVALQKRFFDHFLKGENNGWDAVPPLILNIRHIDRFERREEHVWPLPNTQWTRLALDAATASLLATQSPTEASASFHAFEGNGLTFFAEPFENETELTGPLSARLFVSSTTSDADLFLTVRLFDSAGQEVLFTGAQEPHAPVTQGWLRSSHRRLDETRSTLSRPVHHHDRAEPLVPSEIYAVDIEIWPTSVVIPAGYRLALTVGGRDFEHGLPLTTLPSPYGRVNLGSGSSIHDHPQDRPVDVFGGVTTLHTGGMHDSGLLLPRIPRR